MLGFNGLQNGSKVAGKSAGNQGGDMTLSLLPNKVWWGGKELEVMFGRLFGWAGPIAAGWPLRLATARYGLALGLALGLGLVCGLGASPAQAARYTAIVVDANSGKVLFARNADRRHYPASLTKMMTLYLTFEALEKGTIKLSSALAVSRRAAGQTPSKLGLKRGQTIAVEDAILALVTKSANDAATVLAEALGGNEANFAGQMTKKAKLLGMKRTRFRNASGLPNRYQRSTARDMATLALALQRDFPQYYHYFSTREFRYKNRTFTNHNRLLRSYRGADGLKTGYIRASGFNVAFSARRGSRRLIGVVLGGRSPKWRDRKTARLMDIAFRRAQTLDMVARRQAGKPQAVKLKPLRRSAGNGAKPGKAAKQNLTRRLLARLENIGRRPARPGPDGRHRDRTDNQAGVEPDPTRQAHGGQPDTTLQWLVGRPGGRLQGLRQGPAAGRTGGPAAAPAAAPRPRLHRPGLGPGTLPGPVDRPQPRRRRRGLPALEATRPGLRHPATERQPVPRSGATLERISVDEIHSLLSKIAFS